MSTRADRLVASLDAEGIDVMLVTNLTNVRYLTGFTGSNGLALVGPGMRAFVSDFRYAEQVKDEVYDEFDRITASQDLIADLRDLVPPGTVKLGFEAESTSVARHAQLTDSLPDTVELQATRGVVERMRLVKDAGEVELIAAAQRIADDAFTALLERGLEGRTEREVALALEHDMRLRGASGPSFDSIVAGGAHGALPHAQPRDVKLQKGQLVVIDWGAKAAGYCSDCTRTVAIGEPGPEAREVYELVLGAQLVGLDEVHAGASCFEVDKAVRDIIYGAGHDEHYGHGLGHGVGLDIHEAPTLSFRTQETLLAGTVVTVEPGVYIPGRLGVRIEDLVVVDEDGIRILTQVTKSLKIVD